MGILNAMDMVEELRKQLNLMNSQLYTIIVELRSIREEVKNISHDTMEMNKK